MRSTQSSTWDPDPSHLSYGNTAKKAGDIAYATSVGVRRFSFDSDGELDKLTVHAPGSTVHGADHDQWFRCRLGAGT